MISDLRYAARSLLRRKGFALVVVLTLALGIGAAAAIYSIVDWFIFQGVSYPEDLYAIGQMDGDGQFAPVIWQAHFDAISGRKDLFSDVSRACFEGANVVVDKEPVAEGYERVSLNFFGLLGVVPSMGRGFLPGEDADGRDQVVIVSNYFWKHALGGKADVLGRKIIVDQQDCTVVGVLREGERLPVYTDSVLFRPLVVHPNAKTPWDPSLVVFARTRPGITRIRAAAELATTKVDLPPGMDWFGLTRRFSLSTIAELRKIFRPEIYWMLVGAVGFLFGIACLNATNLMLVHLVGKRLETSIRLALGAGRWAVVRLLLAETLLLSVSGSILGALVANWLIPVFLMVTRNGDSASWAAWRLGPRTYCVLAGLAVVTSALVSAVPVLHVLSTNIQAGLKHGGGAVGESPRVARLRAGFVVLQATFAVILLVGAGLMVRTFNRLEEVQLGFDPAHRVRLSLNFPRGYPAAAKERLAVLDRLQSALRALPGVRRVAYGSQTLLAGYEGVSLEIVGADGAKTRINGAYVSPDYEGAGGMVLKGGRWLTQSDKGCVMVNEALARRQFGTVDAVGRYLKPASSTGDHKGWNVIGVVGDVRESVRTNPTGKVYMPASWSPETVSSFVVALAAEPDGKAVAALREEIFHFDSRIICYSAAALADARRDQLYSEHLALSVLRVLSAIAMLLTIVGLFSILAYTVDRRMAEFGIRMALGATPASLATLVMRRGLALTAAGVAAGVAGALALTRFMQTLLFETAPYDGWVIAGVAALLVLCALAACLLPAVRASRPDLSQLLKGD